MKDLDLRCKDCDRYLNLKGIFCFIGVVRCSNVKCKALNNIKVVTPMSSPEELHFSFSKQGVEND